MSVTVGKRVLLAKTCLMCNEFKQAKDFARVARVYRNSYCNLCRNAAGHPSSRANQTRSLNAAVRHREPWSDRDIARLLEMAQRGLSGPAMALALNRSTYAVYTMRTKLKKEES